MFYVYTGDEQRSKGMMEGGCHGSHCQRGKLQIHKKEKFKGTHVDSKPLDYRHKHDMFSLTYIQMDINKQL